MSESGSETGVGPKAADASRRGAPWLAVAAAVLAAAAAGALAFHFRAVLPPWALVILGVLAGFGSLALVGVVAGFVQLGRAPRQLAFFTALVDSLADACVVTDRRGRVVFANNAYRVLAPLAGHGGRLVGVENLYSGYPDIAERIYRLAQAARAGEAAEEEFRLAAGSAAAGAQAGTPAWIRITVTPLAAEAAAELSLWRLADVTKDRQRQEDAFAHLQSIIDYLDHAPAGFFSSDASGRIEYLNATLAEWLGIDLSQAAGAELALKDLVAESGTQLLAGIAAPANAVRIESFDVDLKGPSGRELPVRVVHRVAFDAQGRPRPSQSLVLDRRPECNGGGSAERLSRLFNGAPLGIAEVDAADLIRDANAAFAKIGGKAAARGASLLSLIAQSHRAPVAEALEAARAGEAALSPLEVAFAGEAARNGQMYFSRIAGESAARPSVIVYAVDTTEHKALQVQFAQSQKMQAIGQLAGGIAHDFNNVLTAIIGFSDLLLVKHRNTDPAFGDIMNIRQNANRAANLVRQLLAFSRRQTLRPAVLLLTDVLSDMGNLLKPLLGEKIGLKVSHGRDLWLVKADINQFEQVIMNLAVNARDAMPSGGSLAVRTANLGVEASRSVEPQLMPAGEYVLVEVADTGTGMAREVLEKIYEPFFSTKEVGRGTGLGLSTVYGIVKQTGGFIFCDSEVGRGSTFRIYLPRHVAVAGDMGEPRSEPQKELKRTDLTGKGTVLLVEDEDAVRAFAARALAQRGYTVLEVDNGQGALEIVEARKGEIDLVLSDVVMPGMDGPSLLKEMRRRGYDTKVIFISGYAEDAFEKHLEGDRDFTFLPKPFTLKQLAQVVKEVMES